MILYTVWTIAQIIVAFYLTFPVLLLLFHQLRPKTGSTGQKTGIGPESDYAIIVTAYEDVSHIPKTVDSILRMNYNRYLIYIVADKCDVSGLHFSDERVIVLSPPQILASNIKSHFYAIENFRRDHEKLTIIDSDNLVDPDYLSAIDTVFQQGYSAVQGIRLPKNTDTNIARLDAARDIYYHFYDGKILFGSGSSSTLSGSGMAFLTDLYIDCLKQLTIPGAGFDKVLQFKIVDRGLKIAFAEEAKVFDTKTSESHQLVHQRTRWIYSWFRYSSYGFALIFKALKKPNWNQLLFGLVLLRPPLFMFLSAAVIMAMLNILISPAAAIAMTIAIGIFVIAFFTALRSENTDEKIYSSLVNIPKFMFLQLLSLTKIRKVKKMQIATRHREHTAATNIQNGLGK